MKWVTIMLLIVLAFMALTPVSSFSLLSAVGQVGEVFANLDVCHSATPAVSSNGEMPCVHMTANGIIPEITVSVLIAACPVFPELILATRNEQPPQS